MDSSSRWYSTEEDSVDLFLAGKSDKPQFWKDWSKIWNDKKGDHDAPSGIRKHTPLRYFPILGSRIR